MIKAAWEKKTHPVTFLDERTLKIEPDTRLGKTIFKAILHMAKAKFGIKAPPNVGMRIIFDQPLAENTRSYERKERRD